MKIKKINKEHKIIPSVFRLYCALGNSPRSFSKYISGGSKSFTWLVKNNKEFNEINVDFKDKKQVERTLNNWLFNNEN